MSYALFSLKTLLILGGLALLVTLFAAVAFAWSNPTSKTIALATAALFGTAALLILQIRLELRASEESDFVSVEFTIDRATPVLRQWDYSPSAGIAIVRLSFESGASEWLAKNSPAAFSGDRERLTCDFELAEVLLFFARAQPDWRFSTTTFKGSTFSLSTGEAVSKATDDYIEFSRVDFAAALKKTDNALAGYVLADDAPRTFPDYPVRFPPKTSMTAGKHSLTLSDPFGSLQFTVVPSPGVMFSDPEKNESGSRVPSRTLPNGEPQFEQRIIGIRIINRQAALYSQHRDAAKYAAWRKRVVNGLHSWFEQPSSTDSANR